MPDGKLLVDAHGRILRDLRVSLTDRCNYRCLYCLPSPAPASTGHPLENCSGVPSVDCSALPRQERASLLSFEEIELVVRVCTALGIEKVRLTGGEPLLRRQVEELVRRLALVEGVKDLAMTTNGSLFAQTAKNLKNAGLRRVTFSLDALDPTVFRRMTGRDTLGQVLNAIVLARELGFDPVKINSVVIRGVNQHQIEPLAAFGRQHGVAVRFIEFMPLDSAGSWAPQLLVSAEEILSRLRASFQLEPIAATGPQPARRWRFADGSGEVGVIAAVTRPFCGACNRLRLTADGKLLTCLFSPVEHDLRPYLRPRPNGEVLAASVREIVRRKEDRHHFGEPGYLSPARTMSSIGG